MTKLVLGHDAEVAAWVASRLYYVGQDGFGPNRAVGLALNDELIGGVVYHDYRPSCKDIQMSIAATTARWATPGTVRWLLAFPFFQYGCQRVTALVPRKNKRSRRFNEGIGFKLEGVVRRGFGNDDCMIYGMLKTEAKKWFKESEIGQKVTVTPPGT